MAGVLKETNAIKEYWLEPSSRRVEPVDLSITDLKGTPLERIEYSVNVGAEIRFDAGRRHGILVDFGKEVGGYPHIDFGTGRCRRVGVQAVESVEHIINPVLADMASKADPALMHWRFRVKKERRVDLPHCGGFRYLWLYPECPGRVTLKRVWLDYTAHLIEDPDSCGYFLCDDETLNRAWFAGLHTLEMCTVDPKLGSTDGKHEIGIGDWVLVDGAKRDRLIWTGDLSPMAAGIQVSDYNNDAIRDSLLSLAAYQEESGYIPACSPGPVTGRIASGFFGDYVGWWVIVLYVYFLHSGETEVIRELEPAMKRALHYLHSQCRAGLFRQTPFNMMEWCFTVIRRGKPSYTNVVYYWALNCASFLAHALGQDDLSSGYVSRAFRLGEAIERELWDGKRGVFVDSTADRVRVPQDANSLAIVSGLVSEPMAAEGILDYLEESLWVDWGSTNVDIPYHRLTPGFQPHNKRVIPFMNNFEALARFTAADEESAMELIRRCWGNMLNREPGTTFWEWAGRDGEVGNHLTSLCHGWSAGVVPLLSKFVLGIRPVGVEYRPFKVAPRPGGLEWVEGRVPVRDGFIEARVERVKDRYDIKVSAPDGYRQVEHVRRVYD